MYGVRLEGSLNPMYGRKHTDDSRKIMSDKKKGERNPCYGKFCINNGEINRYIPKGEEIPDGWVKGKITRKREE